MIIKIISGLLGVSLLLSNISVDARTIWLPGKTNGGSRLAIETSPQPTYNPATGLTQFFYGIQDGQGQYRTHKAETHWCYQGIVQRHPKVGFGDVRDDSPIWYLADPELDIDPDVPIISADSKASLNLLKAVCAIVNL
ncbi:hypothetical protein [Nostoc sp.]|uniref:hypothetical protein n=1 Tax=Nostoc sp. TaxID=1180 RepID=UPI002FF9B39C